MSFIIRRASPTDLNTINKLLYEVNQVHYEARPDIFKANSKKYNDEEILSLLSSKENPVFVAELDTVVVGYAFCKHQQPHYPTMNAIRTLYIDDLCVDETIRGKHIGKRLYEHVIAYAKEQGYYNVTLNVWADNLDAYAFYQKIGLKIQKIGMEIIL